MNVFNQLPIMEMQRMEQLLDEPNQCCFAKHGQVYFIYSKYRNSISIAQQQETNEYSVNYINPTRGERKAGMNIFGGKEVVITAFQKMAQKISSYC